MRLRLLLKLTLTLAVFLSLQVTAFAELNNNDLEKIDRIQLVTQQTNLLKTRLSQAQLELTELQKREDQEIAPIAIEKASKSLLDKAFLDISVTKSNLDSVNIELADGQQTINWLGKSIQEIQTQLNVLNIFGSKVARSEISNIKELRSDLKYQEKLLILEKKRFNCLQDLQKIVLNNLELRRENFSRINTILKSRKLLLVKQQQVKDELAYQQEQNHWLQELSGLYARFAKLDPLKAKDDYTDLERAIFLTNEKANYAYVLSLIARYTDQIQQMNLSLLRINSISLLNQMSDQVQILNKQMSRLDSVLKTRTNILDKHITYLALKKKNVPHVKDYLNNLDELRTQYKTAKLDLVNINKNITNFRGRLDRALQSELSARQGFPTFGHKAFLDLGKELLFVPTLAFQVVISLSTNLMHAFKTTTALGWTLFAFAELILLITFGLVHKLLTFVLNKPSKWRDRINSKWLSLQWLKRNLLDLFLIGNVIGMLFFFDIPLQNFMFIIYLSLVWFICKSILVISRLCLVETTHHTRGLDVKLHRRLQWITLIGGVIVALTVFVHQLPLIYDLKMLCDQLFLCFLMLVALLLLRSWDVVPNLILSHAEARPRYFHRAIRLIGLSIPLLMFGNSLVGLIGYMNLVMTISWYEGIFLIVFITYIILRGVLSDGMEQLSRLMIQYVSNGWLWTEAFLKPLDKVFRITLFLMAWACLFLLFGWDKQSPIVERLVRLLNYHLFSALKTTITPLSIIELVVLISIFYWTAKWTREFVYRLLLSRTKDMGIRNSIAILSQYGVIILAVFICLRVLGIDLQALTIVTGMFAFGIGWGLRDLANNFACGFLILLERPLRVGDIVCFNDVDGEVVHIGSRAVTVRTSDHMELVVPNVEIFNKSFTNWTAHDNIVRTVTHVKISRYDNPHAVKSIIEKVLASHEHVLTDPMPEVFLKEMSDVLMDFELRYHVNIRIVKTRVSVISSVLMRVWDEFAKYGIKPPQHEIFLRRGEMPALEIIEPNQTRLS